MDNVVVHGKDKYSVSWQTHHGRRHQLRMYNVQHTCMYAAVHCVTVGTEAGSQTASPHLSICHGVLQASLRHMQAAVCSGHLALQGFHAASQPRSVPCKGHEHVSQGASQMTPHVAMSPHISGSRAW